MSISVEMVTAIFAGIVGVMSAPGFAAWFKAREAALQARRSVHQANDNAQALMNSIAKVSLQIDGRVSQLLEGKDQINQKQQESIERLEAIIKNMQSALDALVAGHKEEAAALLRPPVGTKEEPIHVSIDVVPGLPNTEVKP